MNAASRTISYSLSTDFSEIRYSSAEDSSFAVTTCTRANLNLTGSFVLPTGSFRFGFARAPEAEGGGCVACAARSFCTGNALLLSDCGCEFCTRGTSFSGDIEDPESRLQCARCPFTCSSLGLELLPKGGDSCFICNEELSLPNFDQSNCLTLEGWWVEKPVTIEDLRELSKSGPKMLFADRLRRCYPNPDAPVATIKDSLRLRALAGEFETIGSHCRRNSLIYPSGNFSTASFEVEERCNAPSEGGLCLGCELGFTKRGSYFGNCTECGELDDAGVIARIVLNVWVVLASVYFTLRTEADFRRKRGEVGSRSLRWTLGKIFLSHLQMLSAFAFVSVPWKGSALFLFKGSEFLTVARIDLSCQFPNDFFAQELIYILVFWATMIVTTLIAVFVHHLYLQRGCDVCALKQETLNVHVDLDLMSNKITAAIVAAVIAMHFLCTSITLQLLSCVSVDFNNNQLKKSFLLKDPKLQCWAGELGIWQLAVGVPVLVLLLIFIPLYLCWLIKKRRFAFLTYFYKEEHAYWDVIVLWRKVLFLFTVVLLTDYGEAVESTNAAIVLGLAFALHCYYLPYASPLANFVDGLGLLVLIFTLSIGTFQSSAKISTSASVACNVFIIVVNVVYVLIFPVLVGLDYVMPRHLERFNMRVEDGLNYFFRRSAKPMPPAQTTIVEDTDMPVDKKDIYGLGRHQSADVSIPQLRGNVLGVSTDGSPTTSLVVNDEKDTTLRHKSSSEVIEQVHQVVKPHYESELKQA